jgi:chitin deacetylase
MKLRDTIVFIILITISTASFALSVPYVSFKEPNDINININGSNKLLNNISSNISNDISNDVLMLNEKQPFPSWLTDFTGLNDWPDKNPPYIPLDFIDFNKIPDIPLRKLGKCPLIRTQCSFDCFKCVSYDDVYTCPKLSQTFDDGPTIYTIKLLNYLKNKTTFFTLGLNVVKLPEIYKEIKRKGHLIGTHTWSHKFLPSLTNEEIIAQFEWSIWAMNATGNHLPRWYRPPYGGIDDRVRSIARMFGMQAVLWDHDSFDWQMEIVPPERTSNQILNDIYRWKYQGKGGLILEHDVYKSTSDLSIEINEIIGPDQLTVAQCVNGLDYVKEF